MQYHKTSLDTLCASLCFALKIDAPKNSNTANETLNNYIDKCFGGKKADRIFMYNPDAIGEWVYQKYPQLFSSIKLNFELELPLLAVMPSVTPVCFGTMYTGAQPCVHGITQYEKPVIKIDTFFDALLRAGKKPVILASKNSSLANIFLERDMDYYRLDNPDQVNAKAAELMIKDEHDVYIVYNGNYDAVMHKTGPESVEALGELKSNCRTFAMFSEIIKEHWQNHNTLAGFAMDHGCHEIDGDCGSHGLDMAEDLNIMHLYKAYPGKK